MTKSVVRAIRLQHLEKESGITSISLRNFQKIMSKGYKPIVICFEKGRFTGEGQTKIYFIKNDNYSTLYYCLFTGFNAGYWGESSRGFQQVLEQCNFINNDKKQLRKILLSVRDNIRHIFLIDSKYDGLHHIKITQSNLKQFTYCKELVKLKTEKPVIFKNID